MLNPGVYRRITQHFKLFNTKADSSCRILTVVFSAKNRPDFYPSLVLFEGHEIELFEIMFMRKETVVLTALFVASLLSSSEAICKYPKETKTWKRKSLIERAVASDIVIYGEVIFSPCWKPGYVKPTPLPTTALVLSSGGNASNATGNATVSAPQVVNATILPTTPPYNCSSEFYSAIIKVICVLKGGSVPLLVQLEGFGHGQGICLDESSHDYHAFNMLKYLIFIGR